jgi:hypothetical protein
MKKLWNWIVGQIYAPRQVAQAPEQAIIALSRAGDWSDYPASEVRGVYEACAQADIVINLEGVVIKDRHGNTPRLATLREINAAKTY